MYKNSLGVMKLKLQLNSLKARTNKLLSRESLSGLSNIEKNKRLSIYRKNKAHIRKAEDMLYKGRVSEIRVVNKDNRVYLEEDMFF